MTHIDQQSIYPDGATQSAEFQQRPVVEVFENPSQNRQPLDEIVLNIGASVVPAVFGGEIGIVDPNYYKLTATSAIQAARGKVNSAFHDFKFKKVPAAEGVLTVVDEEMPTVEIPTTKGEKALTGLSQGAAWTSLLFGETATLWAEGKLQLKGASAVVSTGVAFLINGGIDLGAAWLASLRNIGKKVSSEDVIKSGVEGLTRGGAMGVINRNLPPSKSWVPALGYLAVNVGIVSAGAANNMAAEIAGNPQVLTTLVGGLGLSRGASMLWGYDTFSDRVGDKLSGRFDRMMEGRALRRAEKSLDKKIAKQALKLVTVDDRPQIPINSRRSDGLSFRRKSARTTQSLETK